MQQEMQDTYKLCSADPRDKHDDHASHDHDHKLSQRSCCKQYDANMNWLQENDTTKKELALFEDGEKLNKLVLEVEDASKKLGASILSSTTVAALKESKAYANTIHEVDWTNVYKILAIAKPVFPLWFLSLLATATGTCFWTIFDDFILTGKIALEAIDADGKWDPSISATLAFHCAIAGFLFMFCHGVGSH